MPIAQLPALTENERLTLQQMAYRAPKPRHRQRAQIVLLADQGLCRKEIAHLVGVHYNSVIRSLMAFSQHGFLGLYDAEKSGRPPQLTPWQKQQIAHWMEMSPRELHYQQGVWTMKLMARRIKAAYGVKLTEERVRQIVHSLGFVLVRPKHQSRLASDEEIAQAKEEIEELFKRASEGEFVLFYQDESRLTRFPTVTRMWVRKGTQYQIPTDDDHTPFWVYAVTNPHSGKVHYRIEPSLYSEGFVRFLKQLRSRYPEQRIVIITDNASAHHAKVVKDYLRQDKLMELYFLPSYTPQLNRIERLWKWLRKQVTHIHLFDTISEMKEAVRHFFRYINGVPKKVLRCLALL